jgi:hypothetical protein
VHELQRKLRAWQSHGLITSDQAEAIARHEDRFGAAGRGGVPVIAEAFAYLGAALVLAAAVQVGATVWEELAFAARLAFLAAVSAGLWAAGWWAGSSAEPALARLCSLLWALSATGVAFFAETVASQGLDLEAPLLVTGPVLLGYAVALYLRRRTWLQLGAVAMGVALACGGIADLFADDAGWFGAMLWLAGVAWLGVTRAGALSPRRTSYVLGSVGVLVAAQTLALEYSLTGGGIGWALWLGVLSAAGLLALSVVFGEMTLLGAGTAGLLVFLPQLIDDLFGGLGGPVALLVAGAATLGVALGSLRLKGRVIEGAASR